MGGVGTDEEEERVPLKSAHSDDENANDVPIDPDAIGDFNYRVIDSEWSCCTCCCCCCCSFDCLPSFIRPRKMGAAHVFWETKAADGTPQLKCMIGAGWTFSIVTYLIMFGLPSLAYAYALPKLHWAYSVLAYGITLIGFVSLARTSFGDPGIFPRYSAPKAERWRYFERTKSYRPPGVTYCSENGVLVEEMDHFCPWTGTTIAKKNLPFFHSFLCMLMMSLIYAMFVVAMAMGNSESLHLRGSWRMGRQMAVMADGTLCAEIKQMVPNAAKHDPYGSVKLECGRHAVIRDISFAEWGLPSGECGSYKHGTCGVDAIAWAKERCDGLQTCELSPNHQEELGDPCFGKHKTFKLMAKCVSVDDSSLDYIWALLILVLTIIILVISFYLSC